ncbi:MAG: hypothetical protein ACW98K_12045, partial [Candidatus Kariarchaeaceae archaeon]
IHRLILFNTENQKGCTLYDDGLVSLDSQLLMRLIQTMMLLSKELGPHKGELKETELGSYQIGIVARDHLAYVIIQDSLDNEPFTSKILNHVVDRFHLEFIEMELNEAFQLNERYKQEVAALIDTMKFPRHLLPDLEPLIQQFHIKTHNICDSLFLTDLDDGLVQIFQESDHKGIVSILLEILSEIPFERQWIGESELTAVWFIQRLGMTDFCIAGRAFYQPETERQRLVHKIEQLTDEIHQILLTDTSWFK